MCPCDGRNIVKRGFADFNHFRRGVPVTIPHKVQQHCLSAIVWAMMLFGMSGITIQRIYVNTNWGTWLNRAILDTSHNLPCTKPLSRYEGRGTATNREVGRPTSIEIA